MERSSWQEAPPQIRDLDDIVEHSPYRAALRWLALLGVGAIIGWIGWSYSLSGGESLSLASKAKPLVGEFEDAYRQQTPSGPLPPLDLDAAPKSAGTIASGSVPPLPTADPEAGTQTEQAGPPDEGFYIQAASLRSRERCELLVKRLRRKGHEANRYSVGLRDSGWWHTVRIGPFGSRVEAEIYRLRFFSQATRNWEVLPRSNGRFHVQVASLRSREKAEALVEKLVARGHRARRKLLNARGQQGIWHAVRIGPFDTRADAETYRMNFETREQRPAVVVPYEPHTEPVE